MHSANIATTMLFVMAFDSQIGPHPLSSSTTASSSVAVASSAVTMLEDTTAATRIMRRASAALLGPPRLLRPRWPLGGGQLKLPLDGGAMAIIVVIMVMASWLPVAPTARGGLGLAEARAPAFLAAAIFAERFGTGAAIQRRR